MHSYKNTVLVSYTASQLFEVITDIENYPHFIPWCSAIRILDRSDNYLVAEVVVSAAGVHENYKSKIVLTPLKDNEAEILVSSDDHPFENMRSRWKIKQINEQESEVSFFINFQLKSKVLDFLITPLFQKACKKALQAFQNRAKEVFGQ